MGRVVASGHAGRQVSLASVHKAGVRVMKTLASQGLECRGCTWVEEVHQLDQQLLQQEHPRPASAGNRTKQGREDSTTSGRRPHRGRVPVPAGHGPQCGKYSALLLNCCSTQGQR